MLLPFLAATLALTPAPRAPRAVPAHPTSQSELPEEASARTEFVLTNAELSAALAAVVGAHGTVAAQLSIGRARSGAPIEGVRLAGPPDEGAAPRPALLLVAGLDGTRVFESGVALAAAERLADGYGTDESITALLDRVTLYVLPRIDVDAAAARFATPRREAREGGHDFDDDHDGRWGEDPPQDVDGDGFVTLLRVPDPAGEWMPDPADSRAMIRAEAKLGQRGAFALHTEGRDLDGDERVAEDPLGDALLNHNFPASWEEHTPRAGLFPTDEPGARALADFVLQHTDIALVLTYGELDNLVAKAKTIADDAPAKDRVPQSGLLQSDADLLAELGKEYGKTTGILKRGTESGEGSFETWCYEHLGLWTVSAKLWEMPLEPAKADESTESGESGESGAEPDEDAVETDPTAEAEGEAEPDKDKDKDKDKEPEPSDDAKRLTWIDAMDDVPRFRDWTPFEHPELGPVEIGGFLPWALLEPPVAEQAALADGQFRFLLQLAERLPRIEIRAFEAEALGAGLLRLTATVENSGYLPLRSTSAGRTRTLRPARLRLLLPESATLVAGAAQSFVDTLPGSGGRHETTWLVRGAAPNAIALEVSTDHAGTALRTAEVTE